MSLAVFTKEEVVGDEQEEYYAERLAAFEQQFQALPPPGTAAYWQAMELAPQDGSLPPEVISRCLRERFSKGARQDAERIFDVILLRSQSTVQYLAKKVARQSHGGQEMKIAEDLENESYLALWKELTSEKRTFLFVNFQHALKRIIQHTAHAVMEQEGFWTRAGVEHPTRVPSGKIASLEANNNNEPDSSLAHTIPDPTSQEPPGERELQIDVETLLAQLDAQSRCLILGSFIYGYTQKELAAWLNITDRTVRNRIDTILTDLRRYLGGEEEQHA